MPAGYDFIFYIYNLTHNSNFLPGMAEYFTQIAANPRNVLSSREQDIPGGGRISQAAGQTFRLRTALGYKWYGSWRAILMAR